MPRCCNENKSLRLVSSDQQRNSENILLTREARPFSVGGGEQLDTEEETPVVVERSHRRVRCDLSPVPTNSNSGYIKLIGIKVSYQWISWQVCFEIASVKSVDLFQDKSARQDSQARHSSGSSGHRDRDKEAKKRAAIGNAVRGLFSSGHSRQDRYNDVCIKITLLYIIHFIPLLHRTNMSKISVGYFLIMNRWIFDVEHRFSKII